jgi:hypothetical protein
MCKSSRAELGNELRRDQRRGVASRWRCGARWAVIVAALGLSAGAGGQTTAARGTEEVPELPDAPSAQVSQAAAQENQAQMAPAEEGARAEAAAMEKAQPLRPCKDSDYVMQKVPLQGPPPCIPENPISPFVTSAQIEPLTSRQKGHLAIRDFLDPFNFITIAGYSAVATAANPNSPYGPGFKGFGKLTGYGLVEDAQGEFFQTYVLPSLLHEDPRYHRMPTASFKRRLWHAIEHTYVSQHDDGRPMPNYATLGTYVISAQLMNLYVPGIQTDGPSTAKRIGIGIATDPAGAIVAEFLPDVAKRIHIHIVFVQQILNQAMVGAPSVQ